MLIRYKKDQEKIAMGLLSFMPEEKDVKVLLHTIKEYETNPNCHLYLWRDDGVLGAIGLKMEGSNAVIQHITVNPSHRNLGIGKEMINAVKALYKDKHAICANDITDRFFKKCQEIIEDDSQEKSD